LAAPVRANDLSAGKPGKPGDDAGRARECRQALEPLVRAAIESAMKAGWSEAEAAQAMLAASGDIMLNAAHNAVRERLSARLRDGIALGPDARPGLRRGRV
jgi:hypothetical protein